MLVVQRWLITFGNIGYHLMLAFYPEISFIISLSSTFGLESNSCNETCLDKIKPCSFETVSKLPICSGVYFMLCLYAMWLLGECCSLCLDVVSCLCHHGWNLKKATYGYSLEPALCVCWRSALSFWSSDVSCSMWYYSLLDRLPWRMRGWGGSSAPVTLCLDLLVAPLQKNKPL